MSEPIKADRLSIPDSGLSDCAPPTNPYLEAVIETIRTLRPEDLLLIDKLARRLKEIDKLFEHGTVANDPYR